MSDLMNIVVGEYTVIQDERGSLKALRHGEEWRDLVGDNLVLSMGQEIEGLRQQLEALDHQCVIMGTTLGSYDCTKDALNAIIDWHVAVALDPKVNGGKVLVDQHSAIGE